MKKIISLFQRNYHSDRLVRDELVPGAEWVVTGEGIATRKFDGTCCLWRDGKLWRRYELKAGKTAPEGFEPAQNADGVTGDIPGWVPVGNGPDDKWYREALAESLRSARRVSDNAATATRGILEDGTYELCGPKIQNNPEGCLYHVLIRHGVDVLEDCPRTFNALREYLRGKDIEGIVWHHPDGRMVKIKKRDFGLKR